MINIKRIRYDIVIKPIKNDHVFLSNFDHKFYKIRRKTVNRLCKAIANFVDVAGHNTTTPLQHQLVQQTTKPSPAADTSGKLFLCYCWAHGSSMSYNSKVGVRKDVGHEDNATEK